MWRSEPAGARGGRLTSSVSSSRALLEPEELVLELEPARALHLRAVVEGSETGVGRCHFLRLRRALWPAAPRAVFRRSRSRSRRPHAGARCRRAPIADDRVAGRPSRSRPARDGGDCAGRSRRSARSAGWCESTRDGPSASPTILGDVVGSALVVAHFVGGVVELGQQLAFTIAQGRDLVAKLRLAGALVVEQGAAGGDALYDLLAALTGPLEELLLALDPRCEVGVLSMLVGESSSEPVLVLSALGQGWPPRGVERRSARHRGRRGSRSLAAGG